MKSFFGSGRSAGQGDQVEVPGRGLVERGVGLREVAENELGAIGRKATTSGVEPGWAAFTALISAFTLTLSVLAISRSSDSVSIFSCHQ